MLFVLGFSTVFVIFGASATALGQMLLQYRYEARIVGGAIIIGFGLFMIGLLNPSWLHRGFRFHANIPGGRPVGSYVLGLAFAFGWTPLHRHGLGRDPHGQRGHHNDVPRHRLAYSLFARSRPPVPAGSSVHRRLPSTDARMRRSDRPLQIVIGLVMVVMGIAMMTGYLSAFSYWLLDIFPGLATIG